MQVGFVLVCDSVRPRPDGLFDAIGAGYQFAGVDPVDRMLRRTCVVQLICEPEDVGASYLVSLVLLSPGDEALAACGWEVRATAPEDRDESELVGRCVHAIARLETHIENPGRHRLVVYSGERVLAEWPLQVELGAGTLRASGDELTVRQGPTDGWGSAGPEDVWRPRLR